MAKICKYCGAMNGEQAVACSRCHKPLQGGSGAGWHPYDPPHHELPPQPLQKKSSKSAIKVGIGVAALVVIVAVVVIFVMNNGQNKLIGKWRSESGKYIIFDTDGICTSPGGVNSVTRDRYEVNGSKLTIYSTFDSSEFSEEHAETVDTDSESTCWWHTVFEGFNVVVVDACCFVVTEFFSSSLCFET